MLKLLCNFIEIILRHGYSPVDLHRIFRIPLYKNTYGGLLLHIAECMMSRLIYEGWSFLHLWVPENQQVRNTLAAVKKFFQKIGILCKTTGSN